MLASLACELFASGDDCRGIMNGIDMVEWDPAADAHLPGPVHFDATTVVNGKKLAKAVLQVTRCKCDNCSYTGCQCCFAARS